MITKRVSETVATRMRDLKLDYVYQGQAFKMRPIREIMERDGVALEEIAYVGDDVIDLPVMREVGFAVAVANAREQVKAEAHYVTAHAGGQGAGRDVVDFILEAKGILKECIETMIDESNPISPGMDIGNSVEAPAVRPPAPSAWSVGPMSLFSLWMTWAGWTAVPTARNTTRRRAWMPLPRRRCALPMLTHSHCARLRAAACSPENTQRAMASPAPPAINRRSPPDSNFFPIPLRQASRCCFRKAKTTWSRPSTL